MLKNLLLLVAVVCFCYAANAQDDAVKMKGVSIDPSLAIKMNHHKDPVTLILTYKSRSEAEASRKMLKEHGIQFVGPKFEELPIQGIKTTLDKIEWLTSLPGAFGIWENKKLKGDLHQAVIVSRVKDVREDASFIALNGGIPITGRGVGVLVNDSGFDGDDTDIQGSEVGGRPRRIVQNVKGLAADWVENFGADNGAQLDTDQTGGHGSHCMGIIGGDGRKSNGKYTGVAPGAYLIGYGSGAGINILDTDGGFEYVAKHGRDYNIRVMSNSFGQTTDTSFTSFDASHPTNVATKALVDKGVIVVFSSGNSGPAHGTITGIFKTAPWVITVGNGQKDGNLAGSSSRGRPVNNNTSSNTPVTATVTVGGKQYLWENRPTVVAPGTDIVSVRATSTTSNIVSGSIIDEPTTLTAAELPYYSILSGTSMACPHIAGVVALMLEANPNLDWRAVKAILQKTAVPMTQNKYWEVGAGYVNAHAAVAAAFYGLCSTTGTYEQKYGLPADGSFGFDTDPWKTCTPITEVTSRMSNTMPSPTGIEPECGSTTAPLKDSTGANDLNPNPSAPYFDIKEVRFHSETATDFKVTLEVAGNLVASPAGTPSPGSTNYYDVHFTLDKVVRDNENPTPQVVYIVSAFDQLATKQFKLTVRSNDGTTRPVTNALHYESITGVWDDATNTITWTIPKAKLNVSSIPSAYNTAGTRTSRAAKAGDRLKNWACFVYNRTGVATPDGAGVYLDKSFGQCTKTLSVQ